MTKLNFYSITGANDIQWNSETFNNSGIVWNHSLQRWDAMPSGGLGGGITQSQADALYAPTGVTGFGQHYAYSYLVYKDGANYVAQKGSDASTVITDTSASDVLNYVFTQCGQGTTNGVDKFIGSGLVKLGTDITLDATVSGAWNTVFDLCGHKITVNGDFHGIKPKGGMVIQNGVLSYLGAASHVSDDSALIWIYGSSNNLGWGFPLRAVTIRSIKFMGYTDGTEWVAGTWYSGTAIYLDCPNDGTYDEILGLNLFNTVYHRLGYCIKAHNEHVAINNINSYNATFRGFRYGIWASGNNSEYGATYMDLTGWNFRNTIFECADSSIQRAVYLGPCCENNIIEGVAWDLTSSPGVMFETHPSANKNTFEFWTRESFDDDYWIDNGTNTIKKSRRENFDTRIYSISSHAFYEWNGVGGIDSTATISSAMWNFPIIVRHPHNTNKETGIGFSIGGDSVGMWNYRQYTPHASITFERTDSDSDNQGLGKLHFRVKDYKGAGPLTNTYLTPPLMTLYSGSVGINKRHPQDYTLIVSGSTYTYSLSTQRISSQGIYCDWISGNNTNLVGGGGLTQNEADALYAPTGTSGTPGGAANDIQYNTGEGFGGNYNLTWTTGVDLLAVTGQMKIQHTGYPVLEVRRNNTGTAGVVETLTMGRNGGALGNGQGAGIYFKLEDTGGNYASNYAGLIGSKWVNAASETMALVFSAVNGGTDPYNQSPRSMTILGTGPVGILNDTPIYGLDVNGSIYGIGISSSTISGNLKGKYSHGTDYIYWSSNGSVILPSTDDTVSLGQNLQEFKDIYIDGIAYMDAISAQGNITITGDIIRADDTDTKIDFSTDTIVLTAGNESVISASPTNTWISSQNISSNSIKGHYTVPLFATKPADASLYPGQIIRVSGGASDPTYLFISVNNSSDAWVWMQLGVTS